MLTYPWKCTVLHCNHLENTWKLLILMTRQFDYCPSASEGDNQSVRSSALVVSRCFPGGYNVKLYISRDRLAWWLLAFLCCVCRCDFGAVWQLLWLRAFQMLVIKCWSLEITEQICWMSHHLTYQFISLSWLDLVGVAICNEVGMVLDYFETSWLRLALLGNLIIIMCGCVGGNILNPWSFSWLLQSPDWSTILIKASNLLREMHPFYKIVFEIGQGQCGHSDGFVTSSSLQMFQKVNFKRWS